MYGRAFDWWRWRRSMVYRDFQQHYRYITNNHGTTLVKHSRSLIPAINDYLTRPTLHSHERRITAQKLITYTDGSSARRLIDLAKSIV